MTDYKQLCADLVAWAENTSAHYYSEPGVLIRARAALAEPEPEACHAWVEDNFGPEFAEHLRLFRRPKPPSLKEQALDALGPEPLPERGPTGDTILNVGTIQRHRLIRSALERLND